MDIKRLIQDSDNNIEHLTECLSDVNEEKSRLIPEEGKWCIRQILEHLYLSETAVYELCSVEGKHRERSPFDKIISIRNYFGDHTKHYSSLDMLRPCDMQKSQIDLLEKIKETRSHFIQEKDTKSWSEEYIAFRHPLFGSMTKFEWAYFNIYHLDRHTHQIRSIKLMP
jgi:hypothetical protein